MNVEWAGLEKRWRDKKQKQNKQAREYVLDPRSGTPSFVIFVCVSKKKEKKIRFNTSRSHVSLRWVEKKTKSKKENGGNERSVGVLSATSLPIECH